MLKFHNFLLFNLQFKDVEKSSQHEDLDINNRLLLSSEILSQRTDDRRQKTDLDRKKVIGF